jgi:hypothetical protein
MQDDKVTLTMDAETAEFVTRALMFRITTLRQRAAQDTDVSSPVTQARRRVAARLENVLDALELILQDAKDHELRSTDYAEAEVEGVTCRRDATAAVTQVFTIREGEWKLLLDGVMVPAEWNSKGAAEAAIPVERERRMRKAAKEVKCQTTK